MEDNNQIKLNKLINDYNQQDDLFNEELDINDGYESLDYF